MTNEEAIEILSYAPRWDKRSKEAVDMAIEALSSSEIPNSSDTIYRRAAIDALDKRFDSIPMELTSEILSFRRDLRLMPPAEPETGRWIYGEHDVAMCDGYWCDKCGFFVPWDYQHKSIDFIKDYHICPSCGAKMLTYTGAKIEDGGGA